MSYYKTANIRTHTKLVQHFIISQSKFTLEVEKQQYLHRFDIKMRDFKMFRVKVILFKLHKWLIDSFFNYC